MFKASLKLHRIFSFALLLLVGSLFVRAQINEVKPEEYAALGEDSLQLAVDSVAVIQDEVQTEMQEDRKQPALVFELLTCSPGKEVYELYGHTALRVSDGNGMDVVFNYGVFDFNRPYFIWNFVLGRTDYMVQPIPYQIFILEYQHRGSSVIAQRLNLNADEASRLMQRLVDNALPQNREYRYNYLTNNCTTKVRDMIESVIDGEVKYQESERVTYRECLHQYTSADAWAEVGDDMLLGASVDTVLTDRNSSFLPERLMSYYSQAVIYDMEGNSRPLLLGDAQLLVAEREVPAEQGFPLSPVHVLLILAGLSVFVMLCEYCFKRMIWGYDILVMLALGLGGLLVTFMFFFSEHPSVDSNWQIWLFNPLPLFCMPWVVWRAIKRQFCLYHLVNLALLVLFVVFSPWIPQHFAMTTLPLACILLTRPVSYYLFYRRVMFKEQADDAEQKENNMNSKIAKKKHTQDE